MTLNPNHSGIICRANVFHIPEVPKKLYSIISLWELKFSQLPVVIQSLAIRRKIINQSINQKLNGYHSSINQKLNGYHSSINQKLNGYHSYYSSKVL